MLLVRLLGAGYIGSPNPQIPCNRMPTWVKETKQCRLLRMNFLVSERHFWV